MILGMTGKVDKVEVSDLLPDKVCRDIRGTEGHSHMVLEPVHEIAKLCSLPMSALKVPPRVHKNQHLERPAQRTCPRPQNRLPGFDQSAHIEFLAEELLAVMDEFPRDVHEMVIQLKDQVFRFGLPDFLFHLRGEELVAEKLSHI
jgi:hypothetical protein